MATLGFNAGYHDPYIVDMSLMNGGLGFDPNRPSDEQGLAQAPSGDFGGVPGGAPSPAEAALSDTTNDTTTRRVWQPGEATGFYGTVGTNGDFIAPNGQPTGNSPISAESAAFRQTGSFLNPFGGLQAAWNTANPSDLNPISHPSANNPTSIPSIEQQTFGGNPPRREGAGAGPSLPDMAGTPAGPQAMAVGEGWYIDQRGQFHSDNDGANIRVNRPGAGEGYSIGSGTLIDSGKPSRDPFANPQYGSDFAARNAPLPGNLGMQTAPGPMLADMAGLPGVGGPGGGGAPLAGGQPGFANYNPRLGETVAQTYGPGNAGAPGAQGGGLNLPAGFRQQGNSRVVTGPDGTMYVTDASGFLNPNLDQARAWQSRDNLDVNATTRFAPDAIEKLRYLDQIGLSTPEEKRFLQTIGTGTDFTQTGSYAQYVGQHNAEAQRLGIPGQALAAPSRTLPMDQVFPVYKEYGDLLRQLGATNITIRPDNHTTFGVGDNTPIMQWRSANNNAMALTGDTPFANVLDDLAKLRTIAANQQQAHAAAAAAEASNRSGGGGGGYRSPYGGGGGGGGGGAGAAAGGAAPWWSGTPAGKMWAGDPAMLQNYINSPSYDAVMLAQGAGGGIRTSYPPGANLPPVAPWGDGATFGAAGTSGGAPYGAPYFDPTGGVTSGYSPYTTVNQAASANTGYLGDPRRLAYGTPSFDPTGGVTGGYTPPATPPPNLVDAVVPTTYQNPNEVPGRVAYNALTNGVDNVIANSYPQPGSPEAVVGNVVGNTADWVRRHLPFG